MKPFIVIASAALALSAASLAFAQQPPSAAMQTVRAACADDYIKLCPDAKTREDRHQCMMINRNKVSDTCKAAIADMRSKMQTQQAPAPSPAPSDAR